MSLDNTNLRAVIRQIIKESFEQLDEAQKSIHFDTYRNLAFKGMTPVVPENMPAHINVMKEVNSLLDTKLSHVFRTDFDFPNFYIVKLGRFALKDGKDKNVLAFKKDGVEDVRYSYMYLYVYNNKVELIRFGSEFFETDDILVRAAQEFIKNRKINLVTKTENGKLLINHDFANDNVIDITDYSKIDRPAIASKRFGSAFQPKKYKAGDNFYHRDFGPGKVVATKKIKADVPTVDLKVVFPKGEGTIEKTIRMKAPASGPNQ